MKKQTKVLAVLSTAMLMAAVTPNFFIQLLLPLTLKPRDGQRKTETGITTILTAMP